MIMTSALLLRQKKIVRSFERASATTPAMAVAPDQLGLKPGLAWHRLVGHAVLRCPGEGRYFVDLANWQRLRQRRRRIAIGIIVGLMLVLAAVLLAVRLH